MSNPQPAQQLPWEQEALNLVWQQRAPASWQQFRGTRTSEPSVWLAGCGAILTLVVGFGIAGIASLWLIYPFWVNGPGDHYKHAALLSNVSPSSYWLVAAVFIVSLALLITLMVGVGTARQNRQDRTDPDPLLIVLPEGWVQYIRRRDPAQAIAFVELKHLHEGVNPSEEFTTLADLQKGTVHSQRSSTKSGRSKSHAGPWLDLEWSKGDRKDWEPEKCFDKPEAICQAILAAYQRFVTQSTSPADGEPSQEE
jgi:hypothetical protein